MAEFSVNATRLDPYKNFKFKVIYQGKVVAGISKVSALKRTTQVIKYRPGGLPSTTLKSPGQTEYDAVTLSRGVTNDLDFANWANQVWNIGGGAGQEVSLANFRRNLTIEVYNEAGQTAIRYMLYRCWPSEYQALPELDANANAIAIETLKLECEGFSRDLELAEPAEPTITRAAL